MSDPFSANTTLLLHMNGAGGSTVFTDSSGFPKAVARYGNTQISTAQSKWNGSSCYFDGSGDYLVIPSSPLWVLSGVPFTVEAWVYPLNLNATNVIPVIHSGTYGTNDPWSIGLKTNQLFCSPGANPYTVSPVDAGGNPVTISNGMWHHIALNSTNGTTFHFYLNGAKQAESSRGMYGEQSAIGIGTFNWNNPNPFLQGYIQDLRITKGVARYTANFTPPVASLPDPDPVTGLIMPDALQADMEDGGGYRIVGTATELGVAGSFRVRLFHRQSGRCIREVWSNPDGSFAFNHLAYRAAGYFAVAFDHTDSPILNAAIADLITPELMP